MESVTAVSQGYEISVITFLRGYSEKFSGDKRKHIYSAHKKLKTRFCNEYEVNDFNTLPYTPLTKVWAWFEKVKVESVKNINGKILGRIMQYLKSQIPDTTNEKFWYIFDILTMLTNVSKGRIPDDKFNFMQVYRAYHAEMHNINGNVLLGKKHYEESIIEYTSALVLAPANTAYICNRAMVYVILKQFENAVDDCDKALYTDPTCTEAYNHLGTAYVRQNMWVEAIRAFQEASMIQPDNPVFHEKIRLCELKISQTVEELYRFESTADSSASLETGLMLEMHEPPTAPTRRQFLDSGSRRSRRIRY